MIVASGTSNRQTKALAASVRDAVREAGFPKPRIEGEENGEWIIVDCGAAVAHIMQPAIRQYYHLEEIWGDKPVRLKFGAPKPAHAAEPEEARAPRRRPPRQRRSSAAKTAQRQGKAAAEGSREDAPAKTAARQPARQPAGHGAQARPPKPPAKTGGQGACEKSAGQEGQPRRREEGRRARAAAAAEA